MKKRILITNRGRQEIYSLLGIPLLIKEKSFAAKSTYLLGIPLKRKKSKLPPCNIEQLRELANQAPNHTIWFDHCWKGGTEAYTLQELAKRRETEFFLRIQNQGAGDYLLSYYYKDTEGNGTIDGVERLFELLESLDVQVLVINNLAGYHDSIALLARLGELKRKLHCKLRFHAHDYLAVCPNISMLNADGQYCRSDKQETCRSCYPRFRAAKIIVPSIEEWHRAWENCFSDNLDEAIFFSQCTQNIFTSYYPCLLEKAQLIPHAVKELRPVKIEPHEGINIGVLGHMSPAKGGDIILEMAEQIAATEQQVNIKLFGRMKHAGKVQLCGEYKREDLPRLMEEQQIDIILIPSIWPETFSYTTAEGMLMDLPLACFPLGAPAERVKNYEKGLVLSEISASCALREIVSWIKAR